MPNMNIPGDWTESACRQLIAGASDATNTQLRVRDNGDVFISNTDYGNMNLDRIRFALMTWIEGNDYVGPAAAKDDHHVAKIHAAVQRHWDDGWTGVTDDI